MSEACSVVTRAAKYILDGTEHYLRRGAELVHPKLTPCFKTVVFNQGFHQKLQKVQRLTVTFYSPVQIYERGS